MLLPFQFPPVAGELLARGLQEIARGACHDVARNGAFDVDAHGSRIKLRVPSADGSKNVGTGTSFHQSI